MLALPGVAGLVPGDSNPDALLAAADGDWDEGDVGVGVGMGVPEGAPLPAGLVPGTGVGEGGDVLVFEAGGEAKRDTPPKVDVLRGLSEEFGVGVGVGVVKGEDAVLLDPAQ